MMPAPTVAVAGAAGFVGRPLVDVLARRLPVIALSRAPRPAADGVAWRRADLLSYREAHAALAGADLAVYLVHSMMPADRLVQGRFEDLDLQAADNFARACAAHGVRQIVYLGGILPAGDPAHLSAHLRSRVEVERALADYGTPVTVLRAGLVLGRGGSSMELLLRTVKRLPVMICPSWTSTPAQPIALADVIALLDWVLDRPETFGETYDVAGPEVCSYRALMLAAAAELGRHPLTIPVPVLTPTLSRLWVSLVTGAPRALVAPLIESLAHPMLARDRRLQTRAGVPGVSIAAALHTALAGGAPPEPRAFRAGTDASALPMVRSVQRLPVAGADMRAVAAEYVRWLGARFQPIVRTEGDAGTCWSARLGSPSGALLLRFEADAAVSAADRVVYSITGGRLADARSVGRFEFRAVLGGSAVLCSVHGFAPRLAWPIYLATQAPLHLFVMRAFGRHLARRGA